ncbi:hypothetical protein D9615_008959 [Tricholomella constricta]|uniref:Uncharacterized protein n=1 Tax=Tricholomella constricta TaxID=117010 RepID=A0A8H5LYW4_9AGAR|nr:hypothetical protein D9615_008959 [Tricholomella constricta]
MSSLNPLPSSSSSSHPSPTGQTAPQNESQISIIGIVLGVIGALLVAGVIFATLRMKRRRSLNNADGSEESFVSPKQGRRVDRSHPAALITPFGWPGGETPRFNHTPGSDMRIAVRRADGAWDFADPRAPFTPSGVSEIDVLPSPSSSTGKLLPRVRTKEQESKASRYGYDREYDVEIHPPPPAYGYDYGGYLPHAKN